MRGVPGLRRVVVAEPHAVVVPDHRRPLPALAPVAAGPVVAGREGPPIGLGSRQDVVAVRRVAAPVDGLALLVQRRLLADLVVGAVQVVHALRDRLALRVLPGTLADAVASVHGARALR